jgi:hypothetical protein
MNTITLTITKKDFNYPDYPDYKTIIIHRQGLRLTALLIREDNPRLALCQDRISVLDGNDYIVKSLDLLYWAAEDANNDNCRDNQTGLGEIDRTMSNEELWNMFPEGDPDDSMKHRWGV